MGKPARKDLSTWAAVLGHIQDAYPSMRVLTNESEFKEQLSRGRGSHTASSRVKIRYMNLLGKVVKCRLDCVLARKATGMRNDTYSNYAYMKAAFDSKTSGLTLLTTEAEWTDAVRAATRIVNELPVQYENADGDKFNSRLSSLLRGGAQGKTQAQLAAARQQQSATIKAQQPAGFNDHHERERDLTSAILGLCQFSARVGPNGCDADFVACPTIIDSSGTPQKPGFQDKGMLLQATYAQQSTAHTCAINKSGVKLKRYLDNGIAVLAGLLQRGADWRAIAKSTSLAEAHVRGLQAVYFFSPGDMECAEILGRWGGIFQPTFSGNALTGTMNGELLRYRINLDSDDGSERLRAKLVAHYKWAVGNGKTASAAGLENMHHLFSDDVLAEVVQLGLLRNLIGEEHYERRKEGDAGDIIAFDAVGEVKFASAKITENRGYSCADMSGKYDKDTTVRYLVIILGRKRGLSKEEKFQSESYKEAVFVPLYNRDGNCVVRARDFNFSMEHDTHGRPIGHIQSGVLRAAGISQDDLLQVPLHASAEDHERYRTLIRQWVHLWANVNAKPADNANAEGFRVGKNSRVWASRQRKLARAPSRSKNRTRAAGVKRDRKV